MWKPTAVIAALVVMLFLQNLYLPGLAILAVTFAVLWYYRREYQVRLSITDEGLRFGRGKWRTQYTWRAISKITVEDDRFNFFLAGRDTPFAFPLFDPKDPRINQVQAALGDACKLRKIPFLMG